MTTTAALCCASVVLALSIPIAAQPTSATTAPTTQQLIISGGKFYIPATVNNKTTGVMLLDTGSSVTSIAHHIANQLNIPILGYKPLNTFEGTKREPVAIVDHIKAHPFDASSHAAMICDCGEQKLPSGETSIGTLGMDVLATSPFSINFRTGILTIYATRHFDAPTAQL